MAGRPMLRDYRDGLTAIGGEWCARRDHKGSTIYMWPELVRCRTGAKGRVDTSSPYHGTEPVVLTRLLTKARQTPGGPCC